MLRLECDSCKKEFSTETLEWRCSCGGILDLHGGQPFDPAAIERREHSLWRYAGALPVDYNRRVSLGEGWTPLVSFPLSREETSGDKRAGKDPQLFLKLDHLFPSGSYKDRGASILLSKIRELGIERIVEDSSGNAGAAVAAYSAAAGVAAEIYVPADNSPGKLAQIRSYGARLVPVEGNRSDTAAAALRAAQEHYYASHVYNPFFLQGTKTFGYEVWEQLGRSAPGAVVLPVGNGTLLLGTYKAFCELRNAGLIERLPRLIAVQSAACAPLAEAFESKPPSRIAGKTLAEGIAIRSPALLSRMVETLRASGGAVIRVDEEQIATALRMAVGRGFYIEPTAAAGLAGLLSYAESFDTAGHGERPSCVVGVLTGHGLKASEKIAQLLYPQEQEPRAGSTGHETKGAGRK